MDFPPCTRHDQVDAPCPACTTVTLDTGSLDALFHSMRELVDGLHVRRDAYAIVEGADPWRYVQVLADRNGALLVEVSSTEATADRGGADDGIGSAALTPAEELELVRLCFSPPDDWSPNWHRVIAEPWPWPAPLAAALMVRGLVTVLGARPDDLRVTTAHAQTVTVARHHCAAA